MNFKNLSFINLITYFIISLYTIFLINIISNKGTDLSLLPLFFFTTIPLVFYFRKFHINNTLIFILISPIIFISLNELLLKPNLELTSDLKWFENRSKEYKYQFLELGLLFTLATSIILSKFNTKHFFSILLISLIVSIGLNGYTNLILNFDRDLLANTFNPIILYDYTNIALTLIALCYGFHLKNNSSYIVILLALINLAIIVLHGSRGAWLGLPFAFILIFILYFKTSFKKIIITSTLSLGALISSLLIPNSPIYERLNAFNQDTESLASANYNTSVGTRIALWRFAISEFPQAPITGVGIMQLRENICEYDQKVTQLDQCQPHVHSLYLQALAAHGILGLLSILILILTPLAFFIHSIRINNNSNTQLLAGSGIIFTTYLSICFLTDNYFYASRHTMFYYIIVITLIALIMKEKLNKI